MRMMSTLRPNHNATSGWGTATASRSSKGPRHDGTVGGSPPHIPHALWWLLGAKTSFLARNLDSWRSQGNTDSVTRCSSGHGTTEGGVVEVWREQERAWWMQVAYTSNISDPCSLHLLIVIVQQLVVPVVLSHLDTPKTNMILSIE
ncbi:hypothetical protein INR49_027356 [Caranx melampygus]|nr:hypothetical protein INR49_027356 [Caranx melampygus]